eukprot:4775696-Pleurochrysis_carterae.AAC.1
MACCGSEEEVLAPAPSAESTAAAPTGALTGTVAAAGEAVEIEELGAKAAAAGAVEVRQLETGTAADVVVDVVAAPG